MWPILHETRDSKHLSWKSDQGMFQNPSPPIDTLCQNDGFKVAQTSFELCFHHILHTAVEFIISLGL